MSKHFKVLVGPRVYLEVPSKEETKIIVDSNTKEALQKEQLKSMNKLKVYAIGTGVVEPPYSVGDLVLVNPETLNKSLIIPLTDTLAVLQISPFDIIHVW
jgi:hypothetical protein